MFKWLLIGGGALVAGGIWYMTKKKRETEGERVRPAFDDSGMEIEFQEPDAAPGVGMGVNLFQNGRFRTQHPSFIAQDVSAPWEHPHVASPTGVINTRVIDVIRKKNNLGYIVGSNGKIYPVESFEKD